MSREIRLSISEDDPRFVRAYQASEAAGDALEATIVSLCQLPVADRTTEMLRRLTVFLATLFVEAHLAAANCALVQMPRAQLLLLRHMVEYVARNEWFLKNKQEAVDDLELGAKTVYRETVNHADAFGADFKTRIEANYRAWAANNPSLDTKKHNLPDATKMIREMLGRPGDVFWYYGEPSLIAHGKTHAIGEVLLVHDDGTLERKRDSPKIDRVSQLYRATGFCLAYDMLVASSFGLSTQGVDIVSRQLAEALRADDIVPEQVPVEGYPSQSATPLANMRGRSCDEGEAVASQQWADVATSNGITTNDR